MLHATHVARMLARVHAGWWLLVALVLGETALLGGFVANGGAYQDDWWLAGHIAFLSASGYTGSWDYISSYSGGRYGAAALWYAMFEWAGTHLAWLRAASVLFTIVAAVALYLALRAARVGRPMSVAVVALFVVFPMASSIHFWITPSLSKLGMALLLAGVVVTLRAFDVAVRWRRYARHAAGAMLVVGSLTIAETTLPVVLLLFLVYRTRTSWPRALTRGALDLMVIVAGAAWFLATVPSRREEDQSSYVDNAVKLGDQSIQLAANLLAPWFHGSSVVVAAGVLTLFAIAIRLQRRNSMAQATGPGAGHLGLLALFSCAWIVLAYTVYVPSVADRYLPLNSGIGNRINAVPSIGYALLVVAVCGVAASLVGRGWLAGWRAMSLFALFTTLLGWSWIQQLNNDRAVWEAASERQEAVLNTLRRHEGDVDEGGRVLVFGSPRHVVRRTTFGYTEHPLAVPVFGSAWELGPASHLLVFGDAGRTAHYVFESTPLVCTDRGVTLVGERGFTYRIAYPDAWFVAVGAAEIHRVKDRVDCSGLARRLPKSALEETV